MSLNLRIGDLKKLGKVDGKEEFLLDGDNFQEFHDAFLVPENVEIAAFGRRDCYFITGFRGTGKTSLLRYILGTLQAIPEYRSIILFKSDIEEEKRMQISNQVGVDIMEINAGKMGISQDFKSAWTWFILHQIGKKMIEQPSMVEENGDSRRYLQILGLAGQTTYKKILGFLPKIEGAKVRISGEIGVFQGEVDLDFAIEASTTAKVLFSELVSFASAALKKVKFLKCLVIGLDELEVFFHQKEQYDRDLAMVRDLIFSVDRVNQILRSAGIPILLITAIRREVVDAIGVLGQEVTRVVHDRGINLSWHYAQRSLSHPLIEMVRRKIKRSLPPNYDSDPIQDFFDQIIDGELLDVYLLDRSFYRPRDIMWRLTFAQKAFPLEPKFGARSLKETESEYSAQLWSEIEYELSATFSSDDISAISSIFSGIKRLFFLNDLDQISAEKARYSKSVGSFLSRHSLADVCHTLYTHGALGNDFRTGSTANITKNRWIFRGDRTLLIDQRMTLNPALRKALSAIDKRKRGSSGSRR